ncbi:uncharacterized protein LOC8275208 [Ricinus communis]|uniref:uncharacterized protein LOC8275208 n=1 Tax=Ricinus communis TaxID=3988 RepID=UPI0007723B05|nr:uncharacterized protein LOC8275208 [Ricinus communis]|eukprot:XP_015577575.1 uncharacterized protein LOC8275208 [Ricinus communis]
MELMMPTLSFLSFHKTIRVSKPEVPTIQDPTTWSSIGVKLQKHKRNASTISSALPETTASLAIAAAVVGTAATVLVRRTKATETNEIQLKTCEDCEGSGLCSECKGEGFVLKKLSEESAERARLNAKNMATRYTAALPKKWSYCTKCSSARSCLTCGGRGKLSY